MIGTVIGFTFQEMMENRELCEPPQISSEAEHL
jgi:hypothetical protein